MINVIERYIYEKANDWNLDTQLPLSLKPLLRSNKEENGIVDTIWLGKIVFWYNGNDMYPCLITKIIDESISLESIRRCINLQEEANKTAGFSVFPQILDVTKISDKTVIFQQAVKAINYEMEVSRAIFGPERSLPRLERLIESQLNEMGRLFNIISNIKKSRESYKWGQWGYELGLSFRTTCDFDVSFLTNYHLDRMRKLIDSENLYSHMILVEDHIANYFPGPYAVDQIHPNIDKIISEQPAVICIFKFIIAYFRAGPIASIFSDWLYAIAASITDKEGRTITGRSVRNLIETIGLNPDQPNVIWAFVMATYFIRAKTELKFHQNNPFVFNQLKVHFRQQTRRLIKIQQLIERNKSINLNPILNAQTTFKIQASPNFSQFNLKEALIGKLPSWMQFALIKFYRFLYPILIAKLQKTMR